MGVKAMRAEKSWSAQALNCSRPLFLGQDNRLQSPNLLIQSQGNKVNTAIQALQQAFVKFYFVNSQFDIWIIFKQFLSFYVINTYIAP